MIDLLEINNFADAATVSRFLEDLRSANGSPAALLSSDTEGTVRPRVRSTTRIAVPQETRECMMQLLRKRKSQMEAHFHQALGHCEEPQFLRYSPGDFFVPHQDGNTSLIFDHSRFRRISLVLFLSTHASEVTPETYGGGALVFHGPFSDPNLRVAVTPAAGTLIAFRAETTHEVTPITHGERYSIVSWFLAEPD
jgi:SM-20-related protein